LDDIKKLASVEAARAATFAGGFPFRITYRKMQYKNYRIGGGDKSCSHSF